MNLIEMRLDADRQGILENEERFNQARHEDIQLVVNITDTLSASIRELRDAQLTMMHQANADHAAWTTQIQRIWEYLTRQHPNGGTNT